MGSVSLACLEIALIDLEVARELRTVAANDLDEALGVLAADERVDGSGLGRARWVVGRIFA